MWFILANVQYDSQLVEMDIFVMEISCFYWKNCWDHDDVTSVGVCAKRICPLTSRKQDLKARRLCSTIVLYFNDALSPLVLWSYRNRWKTQVPFLAILNSCLTITWQTPILCPQRQVQQKTRMQNWLTSNRQTPPHMGTQSQLWQLTSGEGAGGINFLDI